MKNTIGLLGLLTLLFCQGLQAQELTGTILKDGKPQKNIRVWLKHNKGLAKTDKNGQFTLFDVLPTDTLVMGVSSKYDAQVAVGSQRNITIHLEDDGFIVEAGLDEVTVTAPTKIRTEYISPITLKKMNIINHNTIMRESIRSVSAAIKRFVPGAMQIGKSPSCDYRRLHCILLMGYRIMSQRLTVSLPSRMLPSLPLIVMAVAMVPVVPTVW